MLNKYKELIESNPLHIATVNKDNKPNLSVASDVRVLDDNTLIISCNEMVNTQENIKTNSNVVITSFDDKWVGVRLSGTAKYYTEGKHYDFCKNTFFGNNEVSPFGATEPKGAIVVDITKLEDIK